MHTGIISFADRIVHNIKTNDMKDLILDQLQSLYGIKIIQKQYHKLDENNIKYVMSNPHMCNLRSNGNPYYMFFTLHNDIPIIYFIDKKVHPGYQKPRILLVRGMFDEKLYQNTLIDGEMVKCMNGKWVFLLNDVLVYEGKHLLKTNLQDRLKIMYNLLDRQYTPDSVIDVCEYKVKVYYELSQESITALIDMSKKLNYTCRGIYMWSSDLRYKNKLYNFNEENIVSVVRKVKDETEFQMKKIDESSNPTMQIPEPSQPIVISRSDNEGNESERLLWISQTDNPDVYNLYDSENTLISQKIGVALVPNLLTSKMLRVAFKNKNAATILKVSCVYDDVFNKWYPIEIK